MDNKSNNDKKLMKIFIIIVCSIVGLFIITAAIGLTVYVKSTNTKNNQYANNTEPTSEFTVETTEDEESKLFGKVPLKTTFAIYGVDKNEALADVIIVGSFDKKTKKISTISIPRDTFVKMPADRIKELSELGHWVPSDGMKINAVHSYAGDLGNEYLTKQLEDLLGIKIDYYFELNLQAFNDIVDTIGGIEIDVPERMYYSDPTQNLYINIKPGLQTLDGKTAEGFVRFRQYKQGDIQRIEMQKLFIKEFAKQALNKKTIVENAKEYTATFLKYVNTNMKVSDSLKYIQFLSSISPDDITMETLPGDGQTPYHHDEVETIKMVNKLFFDIYDYDEETTDETDETTEYTSYTSRKKTTK